MGITDFKLTEGNLKKLLVIPIALLLISFFCLIYTYSTTGTLFLRGIELSGGIEVTLAYSQPIDAAAIEDEVVKAVGSADIDITTTSNPATRKQETVIISVGGNPDKEKLLGAVSSALNLDVTKEQYSVSMLGSTLASSFWKQAKWAFFFAFAFMAAAVAFYSRKLMPSVAILVSETCDIIAVFGYIAITGTHISLSTIAAVLMIVGYTVDTNIVLTNKVTKEHEGNVFDRVNSGLWTGITMSLTAIAAIVALLLIGGAYSVVLRQISTILLVGLVVDIFNTWIVNTNILLWRRNSSES